MAIKNLNLENATKKLKELAEAIDFTMLCTNLVKIPFHAVPMSTKRVDEDGVIWFLSGHDSTHNENIHGDSQVQLIYAAPSAMRFLTVFGQAEIKSDRSILKGLYGTTDDAWFTGIDDPNLSAIKVTPSDAHYWDTKNNRLVTLLKMGVAAITGANQDVGEQGDLQV